MLENKKGAALPSQRLRLRWPRSATARKLLPGKERLQALLQKIWAEHHQPAGEIEVNVVDEKTIRRLHEEFLGTAAATDIITFDLGLAPDHTRIAALYLCAEVAARHAARYRVALATEMQRLMIHGILHLLGYDDRSAAQRRSMRRRENRILQRLSSRRASA